MQISRERRGEVYILLMSVLWGLFPVITVLSYNSISPLMSLAWSTFFSSLFFAFIITRKKGWRELKNSSAAEDILWTAFLLGIVYYFFYYLALRYTSPGNASLVALTEIFFSFIFFNVWKKDHFPIWHIFGSLLMLSGAVIVLLPNFTEFKVGDMLVLAASLIAPFGNFFQRSARRKVSSEAVLFCRSVIGTPFLFLLAVLFKEKFSFVDLNSSLIILIINGIFLLGLSKIFWIEGIHRISVTKSNALSSVSPLITMFFAFLLLDDKPTLFQIAAFFPMFTGVIFLGKNNVLGRS